MPRKLLRYSVIVIRLCYSNVRIHEKRHLYLADSNANILDCLCAEIQVIPSLTSAAGLRPTWWPGKLTGKLRLHVIELSPRGGRGPQERTSQDTHRS